MTIQTYGHEGTIHGSEHVDVELDEDGDVTSVWFRCRLVKFEQMRVGKERAETMREAYRTGPGPIGIRAIQYDDGLIDTWAGPAYALNQETKASWFWQRWRKWLSEALADPDAVEHPPRL